MKPGYVSQNFDTDTNPTRHEEILGIGQLDDWERLTLQTLIFVSESPGV